MKSIERFRLSLPAELKSRNWTLRELSRQSGVNVNSLSRFVGGHKWLVPVNLERVADTLGMEVRLVPKCGTAKTLESKGETVPT